MAPRELVAALGGPEPEMLQLIIYNMEYLIYSMYTYIYICIYVYVEVYDYVYVNIDTDIAVYYIVLSTRSIDSSSCRGPWLPGWAGMTSTWATCAPPRREGGGRGCNTRSRGLLGRTLESNPNWSSLHSP